MVNSDTGDIMKEIMLSISEEYDLPNYKPITRVFKEQSPRKLTRFIGKYDFSDKGESNIIVKDNGLEFSGGIFTDPVFLLPETDSTFFNKNTGTYYKFQFEGDSIASVKFS